MSHVKNGKVFSMLCTSFWSQPGMMDKERIHQVPAAPASFCRPRLLRASEAPPHRRAVVVHTVRTGC